MSLARKSAWIIGGTLLVIVASTVAGCASTPLANSSSADKATTSQEIDGSIIRVRRISMCGTLCGTQWWTFETRVFPSTTSFCSECPCKSSAILTG
jgi:hypothetical protein